MYSGGARIINFAHPLMRGRLGWWSGALGPVRNLLLSSPEGVPGVEVKLVAGRNKGYAYNLSGINSPGENNKIDLGTDLIFDLSRGTGAQCTVNVLIRTTNPRPVDTHAAFISRWDGSGYILWTHSVDSTIRWGDNNSTVVSAAEGSMFDGTWRMITGVRDPDATMRLYYDGVEKANAAGGTLGVALASAKIGAYGTTLGHYGGDIDDISIWNRGLSPMEVWMLYVEAMTGYPGLLPRRRILAFAPAAADDLLGQAVF